MKRLNAAELDALIKAGYVKVGRTSDGSQVFVPTERARKEAARQGVDLDSPVTLAPSEQTQ